MAEDGVVTAGTFDGGARRFVAAGIAVAVVHALLAGVAQGLLYTVFAIAAAWSVAAGVRRLPAPRPRYWIGFAAGIGAMAAGDCVWFWSEYGPGIPAPFPSAADVFYVGGYAAIAVAVLAAAQSSPAHDAGPALLDALLVTIGVTVAVWPVLFAPLVADPAPGPWDTAIALAYPAGDVFALAVVARFLLGSTPYRHAMPLLVVGISVALVTDVAYGRLLLADAYAPGNVIDAGWIVMYACYGAVGRLPAMGAAPVAPRRQPRRAWARWVAPAIGALLVPATVAAHWLLGGDLVPPVWVTAALAVVALGWVRVRAQSSAVRDAAAVVLASSLAVLISLRLDLFDHLVGLLYGPVVGRWEVDELVAALPVVVLALAVFAWRRWREAATEVALRRTAEARLVAARVEAEEANRAKSAFLSTMSHELRTPMNAIIGYSHLLLDGMDGELKPQQAEDIGHIAHGADRLLGLVNDVLDLSRIEADRMDLAVEPVDVGVVLAEVHADLAPLARAKGLGFSAAAARGLVIAADPQRLRQVILNLAGNAIKFTDHGSVCMDACRTAAGIEIAVTDTGIGIRPEALPRVFDEFWQDDAGADRRYQGTGLGLAIVRRLVRMHGGEVSVTSEPGLGSRFRVVLPIGDIGAVQPRATDYDGSPVPLDAGLAATRQA